VRWCRLGVNIGFEQDGTAANVSVPTLRRPSITIPTVAYA
jgi:hypothetical protein